MKLCINGKEETLDHAELSIFDLLNIKKVKMPEMVSVQINGDILKRSQFISALVKEGDRVEFLYFMGGGRNLG